MLDDFQQIQQYLSREQQKEQQRIEQQIQKIDRFLSRQRQVAEQEREKIDQQISKLQQDLAAVEGVDPRWQPQSRRDRKLAIRQQMQELVKRRTEIVQELEGSLENAFLKKTELEREWQELRDTDTSQYFKNEL